MSVMPTTIGPYSIDRELGRGGMGVVYLGHDTKLDRQVAIKALPSEVAQDPHRLARFQREARTLAQLDHPNLASIYGVEESDAGMFLVLEFVEGETLADVLERGPLPIDDALDLCAQVAAGVASAHDAGIIHRDLKPANIKITSEGKAKVLDFGLAKSNELASSSSFSESPTLTTPAGPHSPTMPGAVLGTAPYMSPEQARGRRVDKRSDVWGFGCILYECLTGARLFMGETATDSIGAILHKEIDLSLLPQDTPPRARELLGRMLERDKERRLRDLGDAMLELQAARCEIGGGRSLETARRSGPGWPGAVALMMIGVISAAAGVWWIGSKPIEMEALPPRPSGTMVRLTDRVGLEGWATLAPDGATFVYEALSGAGRDLFAQRVGGFNATNLTSDSSADDYSPALSPDGQFLAFRSERGGGGLYVMGATGESPRRLTDFGHDPAWSPDGSQIVFATEHINDPLSRNRTSEIWIVDVATGDVYRIFEGDGVHPSWSPSGHRIACWRYGEGGQRDIFTIRADGTDPVPVTDDRPTDWNPVWSPDGRWLYFSSDRGGSFDLWRIAIDEQTGITTGAPQSLTASAGIGAGNLAFSRDGKRLTFAAGAVRSTVMRLNLDPTTGRPTGEPRSLTPFTTGAAMAAIAPDGSRITYYSAGERQEDLFIINSDGTDRRRLTNDPPKDRGPVWMPDGRSLVFYSDRGGSYRIWTIRIDGSGLELLIDRQQDQGRGQNVPLPSPDGRFIGAVTMGSEAQLVEMKEDGSYSIEALPPPPPPFTRATPSDWSPDSRRVLAELSDDDLSVFSVGLYEIEGGTWSIIEHDPPLTVGEFYSDGRHILASTGRTLVKVDIESGASSVLYEVEGIPIDAFDLAPDDSWLCFTSFEAESDIWMIEFEDE